MMPQAEIDQILKLCVARIPIQMRELAIHRDIVAI